MQLFKLTLGVNVAPTLQLQHNYCSYADCIAEASRLCPSKGKHGRDARAMGLLIINYLNHKLANLAQASRLCSLDVERHKRDACARFCLV